MKFFKNKKFVLLLCDVLLVPFSLICRELSAGMLTTNTVCSWTRFGGKCITCGGTHFVNAWTNCRFIEAFYYNEFLFVVTIGLFISYILLHIYLLFGVKWAHKILKIVYSIPGLIISLSLMMLYFFIRNIPVFILVIEHLTQIT